MKIEKIPHLVVKETPLKTVLGEFCSSTLGYTEVFSGVKLGETKNLLYLRSDVYQNESKHYAYAIYWINGDMTYFCEATLAEKKEIIAEAALFENMALIRLKSQQYLAFNVAFERKDNCFYFPAVKVDDLQQDIDLPIKGISCFQSKSDDCVGCRSILLGEKVDCPKENVHAFWDGDVFTMLIRDGDTCIFVQKECKSFQAIEIGFVLEQEDGTKDLFPYCEVPLEFNS